MSLGLIESLADYIAINVGMGLVSDRTSGEIDNNIFGYIPDDQVTGYVTPDFLAGIFEAPGRPPQYVFAQVKPEFEIAMVQIQVRDTAENFDNARAVARAIWETIGGQSELHIGTNNEIRILSILATQTPYLLRRDDRMRVYYACSYEITKEPDE